MAYNPKQTAYTDTIKDLTDNSNVNEGAVKTELQNLSASLASYTSTTQSHLDSLNAHGATSDPTPNHILIRDDSGRAKIASPTDPDHIARKDNVDAVQTSLNSHTTNSNPGIHGSTSSAIALRIMCRDLNGRAKIAAPLDPDDIARKDTVDAVQSNLTTHTNDSGAHGATSSATANKILVRDSFGRAKVSAPAAADDIARKDTVDAVQTNLTTHANDQTAHNASTSATANTLARRDSNGRIKAVTGVNSDELVTKGALDSGLATKAPSGYGLGTSATVASTDWNNYTASSGYYQGTGLSNQPAGTGTSTWLVNIVACTNGGCVQIATDLGNSLMYVRTNTGTGWTVWKQVVRSGDVVGSMTVSGKLDLKSNNGRLVLPVGTDLYATS